MKDDMEYLPRSAVQSRKKRKRKRVGDSFLRSRSFWLAGLCSIDATQRLLCGTAPQHDHPNLGIHYHTTEHDSFQESTGTNKSTKQFQLLHTSILIFGKRLQHQRGPSSCLSFLSTSTGPDMPLEIVCSSKSTSTQVAGRLLSGAHTSVHSLLVPL